MIQPVVGCLERELVTILPQQVVPAHLLQVAGQPVQLDESPRRQGQGEQEGEGEDGEEGPGEGVHLAPCGVPEQGGGGPALGGAAHPDWTPSAYWGSLF